MRVINVKDDSGHYSRLVKSIKEVQTKISTSNEGLYGQVVKIQSGGVTISNSELDCEFAVPFDDDTEANEAEIVIYNLTDTTISELKKNAKITITAGYGKDTGVIFSGYIRTKKTTIEDCDKVTIIKALDNNGKPEKEMTSISFNAGTKASTILRKLCSLTGLTVAVFQTKRDHTYKDKTTVNGGLMENIAKYAAVCGVSAYVNKSKIYVQHIKQGKGDKFNLNADTGLLSVAEFEENTTNEDFNDTLKGYELEMLLQHRITTCSIINLKSNNANGVYRVKEGSHIYNGVDFTTKVKAVDCGDNKTASKSSSKSNSRNNSKLPNLSKYKGVSIIDGLNSVGYDSSFNSRSKLAAKVGISNYKGTSSQNMTLLKKLGAKVG